MIIDLVTEEQAILVREQIARLEKQLAEWVELLERWEDKLEEGGVCRRCLGKGTVPMRAGGVDWCPECGGKRI